MGKKKKSTAKKTTKKKKSTAKTKTKKKKSTARSSEETALLQLDTSADIESEKKKTPAKLAKQKKTQGKAVGGVSISLAGIVFSVHDQHFFKGFTHEGARIKKVKKKGKATKGGVGYLQVKGKAK